MAGTDNYTIHARELGPMENFVYLLHDNSSDTAAIVDPAWDVEEMLELADSKGIRIVREGGDVTEGPLRWLPEPFARGCRWTTATRSRNA